MRALVPCLASVAALASIACAKKDEPKEAVKTAPAPVPARARSATVTEALFKMPDIKGDVPIRVGTTTISRGEYDQALRNLRLQYDTDPRAPKIDRKTVLTLVDRQLVDRAVKIRLAEESGVRVDPKQLDRWVHGIEDRIGRDPGFKAYLARAGNTHQDRVNDGRYLLLLQGLEAKIAAELTKTATSPGGKLPRGAVQRELAHRAQALAKKTPPEIDVVELQGPDRQ